MLAAVLLLAIFMTRPRGQILGAGFVVFSFLSLRPNRYLSTGARVIAISLAFVVLGGVVAALFSESLMHITRLGITSAHGTSLHRLAELKNAMGCLVDSPTSDCGAGYLFKFYSPLDKAVVTQNYIHNLVGYCLAKYSVMGSIVLSVTIGVPPWWRKQSTFTSRFPYWFAFFDIFCALVGASQKSIQVAVFLAMISNQLPYRNYSVKHDSVT